ncbi:cellulose synthase subunit BcsC-related outer membrane protein [Undibacterium sp. RTI2.1]|uniref:cellulose biosynthesis protein BcsC n=1 Tax=unclassified Undibacterium TaxID=2630295 RepID=UPI002AB5B619|nr:MULTISPECIES: cellulose synthase subunit BcsC-related outer membrane protein [unclassified Undibacterium]MDY7538497.1 cellulose synthase subunit BcsC-related outer membrane protein [Undibacterium sp. 5I1]MEB0031956.1 cellulose synthase subunit BcsC-related outer membrane protein [Undibacterium sp. RTI2.1]MEB0114878.1 cellulose synthase subunit BcsC-related outer membrane protein [Undibacterium sp. RTI2.2]MEB0231536.1 cellulose synthase subunit BcsC-related outer membrane protein [Undibacteri
MVFKKKAMVLALLMTVVESDLAFADSSLNQKLIEQAQYWSQRGRDDNAADAWRKLLKIDPNSIEALGALGVIEAQSGNSELAKIYLAKLKQFQGSSAQVRVVEEAVRRGVGSGKGQLDDARRLAQQGDPEAAVETYKLMGDPSKLKGDAALEYYQTLAGTLAGYNEAKRGIEKLNKENLGNNKYALALAQVLTYRESTRRDGLSMLEALSSKADVAKQASDSWRQALTWMNTRDGNAKYFQGYLAKHPNDKAIQDRLTNLNKPPVNVVVAERRTAVKPKIAVEDPLLKIQTAGFKALEDGDIKTAEAEFQKILKVHPKDPTATGGMGLVKMQQEESIEARTLIKKAIDLSSKKNKNQWQQAYESASYWALIEESRNAFENSDSAKGIAFLREAVKLNGKEPVGILQLGDALLAENDLPSAEANYRQVFNLDKNNLKALSGLINVLMLQKRIKDLDALSSYMSPAQLASLSDIKANDYLEKAKLAETAGDLAGAQLAMEDAILIAPDNVWMRLALAQLYLKHDMPGQARSLLDPLTNVDNPQPDALYVSALLSAQQQLWWEGLVTMERIPAKSRKPEMFVLQKRMWIYVQLDRINLLLKQGDIPQAKNTLSLVEVAAGSEPEFVGAIADLYIKNGDPERGLTLIRQAVQKMSQPSSGLLLQYADVLLRTNQDAELEPVIKKIAAVPKLPEAEATSFKNLQRVIALRSAEKARETGELASAYSYIQPYLIADPEDSLLLLALARMFVAAGEMDSAKELYTRVLQTEPDNIEVRQGLVYAAIEVKDFPIAENHLSALMKLQPDNPRFIALAGRVALAQGRNSKALSYFKQALALEQSQQTMVGMGANGLRLVEQAPETDINNFSLNPFAEKKARVADAPVPRPALREVAPNTKLTGAVPASTVSNAIQTTPAVALVNAANTASNTPQTAQSKASTGLPPASNALIPRTLPNTNPSPGITASTTLTNPNRVLAGGGPSSMNNVSTAAVPVSRTQLPSTTATMSAAPVSRSSLTKAPVTEEEASLIGEIDALNALNRSQLSIGFAARARSGEVGLSQLKDLETPIDLQLNSLGQGQFGLKIIPVSLDAGTLNLNDTNVAGQFGKNIQINERAKFAKQSFTSVAQQSGLSNIAELNEKSNGVALSLSYELNGLKVDIGSSPIGFSVRNVVGGLRWSSRVDEINFGVEVARRSVTDSYLSYAGTTDSLYGLTWGGVTKTGVHLDTSYDVDDGGLYASGGYAAVNGKNVASNSTFDLGGGAYWRFLRSRDMVATTGLNMTSFFYKKNLRYFSYGQGGYFSPKNYIALGVPIDLSGRKGNLAYQIGASIGIQHFTEESSLYYPNSKADQSELEAFAAANPTLNIATTYPGQSHSGIQYKLLGGLEYQIAPQFFVGGRFSIDNSGDFTDGSGAIYLRYNFEPQRKPIVFPPVAPKPYYLGN